MEQQSRRHHSVQRKITIEIRCVIQSAREGERSSKKYKTFYLIQLKKKPHFKTVLE